MQKKLFDNYMIDSLGFILNTKTNLKFKGSFNKKHNLYKINLYNTKEKKDKSFYLHKLMVESFISEYNEKIHSIIFIDGDKKNCSLDNLKIATKDQIIKTTKNDLSISNITLKEIKNNIDIYNSLPTTKRKIILKYIEK